MSIDKDKILEQILEYPLWRHRIQLDEYLTTQGFLILPDEWEFLKLLTSLDGQSFLDVGSNDGYFSFEAERRHAKRVVAVDVYKEMNFLSMTSGWSIEGIRLVKNYIDSKVEIVPGSIYSLDALNEKFDVTFCNNVIAWVRDIPLAIQQLSNATNETLIIQDQFDVKADNNLIGEKYDINLLSLNLIKRELIKNGWSNIKTLEINEVKRNRKQFEMFDYAKSIGTVPVYLNPDKEAIINQVTFSEYKSILAERNGKYYIKQMGWIKQSDLKKRTAKKGLKTILKKIIGGNILDYYKNLISKSTVKDILIIASK